MERINDEWAATRQAEFEAQNEEFISDEEIIQNIREAERTAGMDLTQFKMAINAGKIKNYSIVHLKLWEEMEQLRKEREL